MADKIVQVPGVGEVAFPDSMSDEEIAQAIRQNILKEPTQQAPAEAKPKYRGFGEEAVGLGETALTIGTGLAGQVAAGFSGLIEGAQGHDAAQKVRDVAEDWTYQPRTDVGKRTLEGISKPFQAVENVLYEAGGRVTDDPVGTVGRLSLPPAIGMTVPPQITQALSNQMSPEARAAVGTSARMLPEVAATAGGALRPRPRGPSALPGTKADTLARAEAEGFTALPSQVADVPGVNRGGRAVLENVSKHAEVRRMATARNEKRFTNRLAARALGLNKDHLTPADIDVVRKEANQAYSNIPQAIERISVDKPYMREVLALRAQKNQSFPTKVNEGIEKLVTRLTQNEAPRTQDALNIIRELRNDAKINLRRDDPASVELGYSQRAAADAVEGLIGRNLEEAGRMTDLTKFRQARERLAKAHTIDNAMVEGTGNIDPRVILRDKKKGVPLTGELDLIADTASAFPDVMRATEGGVSARPFTATDLYFLSGAAGFGAAGGGPGAVIPAIAGLSMPLGRMAALRNPTPAARPPFRGGMEGATGVGLFETLAQQEEEETRGLLGR